MRPRLLDLFCGAGGCAVGYHRAGFDVIGVDINPQPNYPFDFHQADALTYPLDGFDAIHASPPCQAFSLATGYHGRANRDKHPDHVEATRARLSSAGVPWVMENVEGSPLRRDLVLCGEMFGLRVHRHRVFEVHGFPYMAIPHAPHRLKGARHNCHVQAGHTRIVAGNYADHADASDAMGVDWMTRRELAQAIPPAYTEFLGHYLMAAVRHRQEVAA